MTTQEEQRVGEGKSSTNVVLLVLFWSYVAIPFFWGLYETLKGVTALFTG